MKSFVTAILALVVIHLMAIFALFGWLYLDDRLDRERIHRVVDLFSITIDEERQQEQLALQLEAEAREKAMAIARLESVADGPLTTADRLLAQQTRDDVAEARVDRMQREIRDLRRLLDLAQAQLAREKAAFDAQREAFEQRLERERAQRDDEDFQQAVSMYEQLRPRQAKQMFQELLAQGMTEQVVDYLAAMQLRRAAAVLKEFKQPEEVAQATELVQRLRERGSNLLADATEGNG